jgi:hypothetical protein
MSREIIGLFFAVKLVRAVIAYVCQEISKNMTSQVYLEKVLVKGENPPQLTNQIWLAHGIEVALTIVLIALLYSGIKVMRVFPSMGNSLYIEYIFLDLMVYIGVCLAIGTIIASKMYSKKYFLYKDDGLRAIRALCDIVVWINILFSLLPLNYLIRGAVTDMSFLRSK